MGFWDFLPWVEGRGGSDRPSRPAPNPRGSGGGGGGLRTGRGGAPVRYENREEAVEAPPERDTVGDFFQGMINGYLASTPMGWFLQTLENMGPQDPWMPNVPGPSGPQGRAGSGYARGPQSGNKPGAAENQAASTAPNAETVEEPAAPPIPEPGAASGWGASVEDVLGLLDPAVFDTSSYQQVDPYSYRLTSEQKDASGSDSFNRTVSSPGFVRLTQDAWEGLSKEQQDALKFNELLLEARNQDLAKGQPYNFARLEYNPAVERMFGAGNDSANSMINTVNLLDSMGYSGGSIIDLDEFASLERAFTWDELQNLNNWDGDFSLQTQETVSPGDNSNRALGQRTPGMSGAEVEAEDVVTSNYGELRELENLQAIDFDMVEKAGEFIRSSMRASDNAWDWRSATRQNLGYDISSDEDRPVGFLSPDEVLALPEGLDKTLEDIYSSTWRWLKDPSTDVSVLVNAIATSEDIGGEEGQSALWDFVARRLAYDEESENANGRSAADIRAALGWEG